MIVIDVSIAALLLAHLADEKSIVIPALSLGSQKIHRQANMDRTKTLRWWRRHLPCIAFPARTQSTWRVINTSVLTFQCRFSVLVLWLRTDGKENYRKLNSYLVKIELSLKPRNFYYSKIFSKNIFIIYFIKCLKKPLCYIFITFFLGLILKIILTCGRLIITYLLIVYFNGTYN